MRSILRFGGQAPAQAGTSGGAKGGRLGLGLGIAAAFGGVAAALALLDHQPGHIVFTAWTVAFASMVAAWSFAAGLHWRARPKLGRREPAPLPPVATDKEDFCAFGRVQWRLVSVEHNWGTRQVCVQLYLVAEFLKAVSGAKVRVALKSHLEHFGRQETKRYEWSAHEGLTFAKGERVEIILATVPKDPDMLGFCGGEFREELLWIWAPSRHVFRVEAAAGEAICACRIVIDLPSRAIGDAAGPFSPFGGRLFVQEERYSPFADTWT